jgi:cytochrome P450
MDDVQPGAAWFDPARRAWILSSHDDVSAALREPRLAAVDSQDRSGVHLAAREAVAHSLSADRLAAWRAGFERSAHEMAAGLPADRRVDLVASFAGPWSLKLAVTVTGASSVDAAELARLAREVFLAAASGADRETRPEAHAAAAELARRLPAASAAIHVQTFVALSQTLPHLLAGAWHGLFGNPAAVLRLRAEPGLIPRAVEELLRHAGPSRAVFRRALAEVRIGCAEIGSGDRVVLMLAAANHDSARFANPDHVDFCRGTAEHLAFGAGVHSCSGARLTRIAVAVGTEALLRTTDAVELTGPVEWMNGFAIRAPASLPAVLRRRPTDLPGHAAHGVRLFRA